MKLQISLLLLFAVLLNLTGQELEDGNIKWNSNRKLNLSDFKIKTGNKSMEPVYSQFSISTNSIGNLEIFKRNFNQKVENIFYGKASWIDTTQTELIEKQIEFQQIQFDLSEIQARKYRKEILLNRKKLASGGEFLNKILEKLMTEFSYKRLELIQETESGNNTEKITEWKEKIRKELEALSEYSYHNTNKIKTSG